MKRGINLLTLGIIIPATIVGFSAGCNKSSTTMNASENTDPTTVSVATSVTTAVETTELTTEQTTLPHLRYLIDAGDDNYVVRMRGWYLYESEGSEYPYTITISSGEKETSGYGISIVDVKVGDNMTVIVEESLPHAEDGIVETLNSPSCVLRLNVLPSEIHVKTTEGEEFEVIENYNASVAEGYRAILFGGSGETSYRTYVYRNDVGYTYLNTTITKRSAGYPNWRETIENTGWVYTKNEIVDLAKKHNSGSGVLYYNDTELYSVNDFLDSDI